MYKRGTCYRAFLTPSRAGKKHALLYCLLSGALPHLRDTRRYLPSIVLYAFRSGDYIKYLSVGFLPSQRFGGHGLIVSLSRQFSIVLSDGRRGRY